MLDWKEATRRKPLIIRGTRQVGKTWVVENVLAKGFKNLAKVDLGLPKHSNDLFSSVFLNRYDALLIRLCPQNTNSASGFV